MILNTMTLLIVDCLFIYNNIVHKLHDSLPVFTCTSEMSLLIGRFSGIVVSGVAQWKNKNVGLCLANFHWPSPDLQLMGNHPHMGKPSAVGQLTRPTQPFILTGSINE